MAKIRVYRDETDGEEFPRLCVRCGGDAETEARHKFVWIPGWVHVLILAGLGPWLIVCLILRKSMPVTLPVCGRHRSHWLNRKLYVWLGLLWWIVFAVATGILSGELPKDVVQVLIGVIVFGGALWLIVGAIYMNSAIKASHMTEKWVELTGVDAGFADEWKALKPPPVPVARRRPVEPTREEERW